ncbi:MAG: hypothetical protein JNN30_10880 [Rhodanobacteraceae bacterium]|nr:hypothetical protein [Rhodanobacteraceae bacterium]
MLSVLWRRSAGKRWRWFGFGILVLGYTTALLVFSGRVASERRPVAEDWVAEVKARPPPPLEPLPLLNVVEHYPAELVRDPFEPLPVGSPP